MLALSHGLCQNKNAFKMESNLTNSFQSLYSTYFLVCMSIMILYIFLVGICLLPYVLQ